MPQHKAEYIEAIHYVGHQIDQRPFRGQTHISFNGSLRDECLNVHWFETLEDAKAIIEVWRRDYNETRPHMALNDAAPEEYVRQMGILNAEN